MFAIASCEADSSLDAASIFSLLSCQANSADRDLRQFGQRINERDVGLGSQRVKLVQGDPTSWRNSMLVSSVSRAFALRAASYTG